MNAVLTIIRQKLVNAIYNVLSQNDDNLATFCRPNPGLMPHTCIKPRWIQIDISTKAEKFEKQVLVAGDGGSSYYLEDLSIEALQYIVDDLIEAGAIMPEDITTPAQDVAANLLVRADDLAKSATNAMSATAATVYRAEEVMIRQLAGQLQNC